MKKLIQKIIIFLLYLTPIGYFLSLLNLLEGKRTPGVYVHLPRNEPAWVYIKENPTPGERFHWLVNGIVLTSEGVFAAANADNLYIPEDWVATFAFFTFIFGVVSLVAAFFPKFKWNVKLSKKVEISFLLMLVLIGLFLIAALPDLSKLFFK